MKIKKLNRFTTLPILLDMLANRKITLLDPVLWEDRNDAEVILEYKKKKGVNCLLALCFTYDDETVHHWRTFSNGNSGCVIEFDFLKLSSILDQIPHLRHQTVEYKKLSEMENNDRAFEIDDMPFIKRWPYRCEAEYRLILESSESLTFFDIEIPLEAIKKITFSQHMPKPVFDTIKNHLRELGKDAEKRISHSTLYENKRWISRFKKLGSSC